MQHISQTLLKFLDDSFEMPEYRPPRWESPIERSLWEALRYIGINAETQLPIGNFRIDMLASSRRTNNKVIVECDGAEFHHRIIDEFRDDELLDLAGLPIAHIYGSKIYESPEKCALYITERWFPEHMDSVGYTGTLEMVHKENIELHVTGCYGFFPVGHVRPTSGNDYPSYTDIKFRSLIRCITGNIDNYAFENEDERKELSALKTELREKGIFKGNLSPQEIARVYIKTYSGYDEETRSIELENFDNFLRNLKSRNSGYSETNGG
jgi:very-short-patch-repair endonuclease